LQNAERDSSDEDMEEVMVVDEGHVRKLTESSTPVSPQSKAMVVAEEQQSSHPMFQPPETPEDLSLPSSSGVAVFGGTIPESDDESTVEWSRSQSPIHGAASGERTSAASPAAETWDAAQEMDPHAEEGEFARFMSQVKGRDLNTVTREIDEEIRTLNQQKKAAMRDSEDITQQMISQIMVCIPPCVILLRSLLYPVDVASIRHTIHNCTDGSRSAVRRTGVTGFG